MVWIWGRREGVLRWAGNQLAPGEATQVILYNGIANIFSSNAMSFFA